MTCLVLKTSLANPFATKSVHQKFRAFLQTFRQAFPNCSFSFAKIHNLKSYLNSFIEVYDVAHMGSGPPKKPAPKSPHVLQWHTPTRTFPPRWFHAWRPGSRLDPRGCERSAGPLDQADPGAWYRPHPSGGINRTGEARTNLWTGTSGYQSARDGQTSPHSM